MTTRCPALTPEYLPADRYASKANGANARAGWNEVYSGLHVGGTNLSLGTEVIVVQDYSKGLSHYETEVYKLKTDLDEAQIGGNLNPTQKKLIRFI